MKIKFWGTRGSIPTPISSATIESKIRRALQGAQGIDLSNEQVVDRYIAQLPETVRGTVGGNTPCIEIRAGEQLLILDAGSGIRLLGFELMKEKFGKGQGKADILMTHTHWDHIQGFPFFVPAFVPGNRLTFYSARTDIEAAITGQQHETYFPVPLSYMRATFQFCNVPEANWTQLEEIRVYPLRMSHPGESYAYRLEYHGKVFVYATDAEYKQMTPDQTEKVVDFFKDADVVVFDAQYTLNEVLDKVDWGHSTPMMGAELAYRANVRRLMLFHHDPLADDEAIYTGQKQAQTYLAKRGSNCQVIVARDGLQMEL